MQMVFLRYASVAVSTFFISAYIAYVSIDDRRTVVAWSFLLVPLVLSTLNFLPVVWPLQGFDAWRTTAMLQHVVGITIACLTRDLVGYCVAFAFAFFFTSVVTLAHARGLVNYHAGVGFSVSSAALYAIIRVLSRVLVREEDTHSRWVVPLFPFILSSLETIAMFLSRTNSYYTFPSHSYLFIVYSLLKASLFLILPRTEDFLISTYGAA